MEGIHDRDRIRDRLGRGLLVPGESVHGDVFNAGLELIRLTF